MKLGGDNPVKRADDDLLGRAPLAKAFAEKVVALDASEGVAVGVLGAWGSGKTSFINLARPHLEDAGITVVDFNPWMFSGSEQLVDAFFVETAAQLKLKPGFDDIAGRLEDYGDSLAAVGKLPFVGGWIVGVFGAAKLLAKHMDRRKSGVVGKRERLEEELRTLKHPIAIVLDDIDRLSKKEIQHVFRMVRLTASFTNLIYLVAFDRKRVEDALGDDGVPGRDYLEKILQVTIDLPVVPNKVMMTQLFGVINAAVKEAGDHGPFEEELWPDVLMEIVRPLIENMRDAKRYAVAVYGGVRAVGTKVALTDLLGLEAVRVFMPDVFQLLGRSVDCLTNSSVSRGIGDSTEEMKAEAQALIDAGGRHGDIVKAVIHRLFPGAQHLVGGSHYGHEWKAEWLRARRVAHEDVLRFYLEKTVGGSLQSFFDAEHGFSVMRDEQEFERYLRSLDEDRLEDVIEKLEAFEGDFGREHVVPGVTVLLNLYPNLPERPPQERGMFDLGAKLRVTRVTFRLLRSIGNPEETARVVDEILPKLKTLAMKEELISDVGYREGCGHKMVTEEVAAALEKDWRDEVRSADLDVLIQEPELFRTLQVVQEEADESEAGPPVIDDPRFTKRVLETALHHASSQSMDRRAIRVEPRLSWDGLVKLYGGKETLRTRIESLKASESSAGEEPLKLAEKYLSGWRPER